MDIDLTDLSPCRIGVILMGVENQKKMMGMSEVIWMLHLPSGKHTKSYGTWPFIVDVPIHSMVIFHSYVKLPEGTFTLWLFNMAMENG